MMPRQPHSVDYGNRRVDMVPSPAKMTSVSLADERVKRNEAAAFFHQMP